MLTLSFRWFANLCVPARNRRKQAVLALTLLVVTGCGGGASTKTAIVKGSGFTFGAPASWTVSRKGSRIAASEGERLISVTRFPLLRRFRPELWDRVVPELDRAAAAVASQQKGTVSRSSTLTIVGRRARSYDVSYAANGTPLVERIAFVLEGKSEYLLLCRYERGGATDACDGLLTSFKLAAA
jgi:hypothetical protein